MDCILYLIESDIGAWRLCDDPDNPTLVKDNLTIQDALMWAANNSFAVFYIGKGN